MAVSLRSLVDDARGLRVRLHVKPARYSVAGASHLGEAIVDVAEPARSDACASRETVGLSQLVPHLRQSDLCGSKELHPKLLWPYLRAAQLSHEPFGWGSKGSCT